MAFLSRNNLFLAPVSGSTNTVSFSAPGSTGDTGKALVAFHQVSNGVIQTQPTQTICPGSNYALKVLIKTGSSTQSRTNNRQLSGCGYCSSCPDCDCDDDIIDGIQCRRKSRRSCKSGGCQRKSRRCCRKRHCVFVQPSSQMEQETIGFLSVNPNDSSTFLLSQTTSTTETVLFQPASSLSLIHTNSSFMAALRQNTQISSAMFLIQPSGSADAVKLGYTTPFPTLLSNCNTCGCPSGQTCGSTGICVGQAPTTCPSNAQCGDLNGRCSGTCSGQGVVCQQVNGLFKCVSPETGLSSFWIIIIIIVVVLILILLLWLIYRYYHKEVVVEAEQPPTIASEHQTVVIGRNVY